MSNSVSDVIAGDAGTRLARIRACLEQAFHPTQLVLLDESDQHAGHTGHGGLGHFAVAITADALTGLAPLARQRKVYAALAELMQTDIHALRFIAADSEA